MSDLTITEEVAQLWCKEETAKLQMDPVLAGLFAELLGEERARSQNTYDAYVASDKENDRLRRELVGLAENYVRMRKLMNMGTSKDAVSAGIKLREQLDSDCTAIIGEHGSKGGGDV
jgi:hypothetical protein